MTLPEKMSDMEIAYISALKEEGGLEWAEITEKFNEKFRKDRTLDSVKKAYQRNRERISEPDGYVKLFRDVARTRKNNAINSKDLKKLSEEWENREDILDAIKGAAKDVNKVAKQKIIELPKKARNKKGMTLELLISDVHVGKLTQTFNHEVLKRRLEQIASTTIKEMQRAAEHYKVDKVILAFLGDLIESATMHGLESAKGCEFGNARQIQECLTLMFKLVVTPISLTARQLGASVEAVGVTGNHDRTEFERTLSESGTHNVSYIIYKTMEEFCKVAGLENVTWHIPADPWQVLDIYGEKALYEHYDNVRSNTRDGLEKLLSRRVNQLKHPIAFMRGGHFHEPAEHGMGKIQVNGNVPGDDGFAKTIGYSCEPSQTLNFYIERDKSDKVKRLTSFYKRFLIQLD